MKACYVTPLTDMTDLEDTRAKLERIARELKIQTELYVNSVIQDVIDNCGEDALEAPRDQELKNGTNQVLNWLLKDAS